MGLPAEYGGSGEPDFVGLGIAAEEVGRIDVGLASTASTVGVMGGIIAQAGTPSAQDRYLGGFISGAHLISLGLTEPASGSDAAGLQMVARRVDGGWRLSGEKTSVSHLADSVTTIVFARSPGTSRADGVSAFVVDLDQPGISMRAFHDMGLREFRRGSLTLDDAFVPDANLLGQEGKGFGLVMGTFDFARATVGLFCLGAAQASLDEATVYMRQRNTFGKPLAARQGLTMRVAEHYTKIEACRWLCYRTLWRRERNLPHIAEAAMCKWWGVDISRDAIETAMLIHGHRGWSNELPFERRFRDVTGFKIGDGAPEIHKLIIARDRIGRDVMN
jgi:cyclohexanecarboxyl-CoA dehydrogenase